MKSYRLRSLFFVTALLALICGWAADHARLSSRIQTLNSFFMPPDYQAFELGRGGRIQTKDEPNDFWKPSGHKLMTVVELERLEACPVWQDDAPNPPVSASDAIFLANAAIPTLPLPGPSGTWQRQTATLMPVGKHWCWVVGYGDAENSLLAGGFSIIVLMDGSVLTPHYDGPAGQESHSWVGSMSGSFSTRHIVLTTKKFDNCSAEPLNYA